MADPTVIARGRKYFPWCGASQAEGSGSWFWFPPDTNLEECLILSIRLEFCIFCSEIQVVSLCKGFFSKSIDLFMIYFLTGQYFLILLFIWVPQQLPSSDLFNVLLFLSP